MAITREQVLKTAGLSHLELREDEVDVFTTQLSNILDYVSQLDELDTEGVPPMAHSTLGGDVERTWRDDEVRPSLGSTVATANAPEGQAGYFKVPNVISRSKTSGGDDHGE